MLHKRHNQFSNSESSRGIRLVITNNYVPITHSKGVLLLLNGQNLGTTPNTRPHNLCFNHSFFPKAVKPLYLFCGKKRENKTQEKSRCDVHPNWTIFLPGKINFQHLSKAPFLQPKSLSCPHCQYHLPAASSAHKPSASH